MEPDYVQLVREWVVESGGQWQPRDLDPEEANNWTLLLNEAIDNCETFITPTEIRPDFQQIYQHLEALSGEDVNPNNIVHFTQVRNLYPNLVHAHGFAMEHHQNLLAISRAAIPILAVYPPDQRAIRFCQRIWFMKYRLEALLNYLDAAERCSQMMGELAMGGLPQN